MKTCSKCNEEKPVAEFNRHRAMKDGRQAWCKKCHGAANKKWFEDNPERKRQLNKRWSKENSGRRNQRHREWYAKPSNRAKERARRKVWYARQDADFIRQLSRRRNLQRYGISEQDYSKRLAAQGGGCAVCGKKSKKRRLSVDHCHNSRKVRGILCSGCNIGIGCLGDSPERLRAAAAYLESIDRSAEE